MWYVPERLRVKFGGVTYVDVPVLVMAGDVPFVTLKRHDDNGYLGIYFDILDASGNKLAAVKRNEIYLTKGASGDYKVDGTIDRYTVSNRSTGEILCDIKKRDEAGDCELEVSVRLFTPSGFLLDASPDETNLGTVCRLKNMTIRGGHAALSLPGTTSPSPSVRAAIKIGEQLTMQHDGKTFNNEKVLLSNHQFRNCKFHDPSLYLTQRSCPA